MGADDADSALERVLRLGLRGPVEREVVRVLLDCAGQETTYNPFYGAVGAKLCGYHNRCARHASPQVACACTSSAPAATTMPA